MTSPFLLSALTAVALLAVAVPAWVVTHPPAIPAPARKLAAMPPRRIVPQAELPPVEPVKFVDLPPEDARAFNETVPFSTLPNPAARAFRFAGAAEDRERARDCLAAGVLYEAGDDATGERAVAQVVLNRLRHPAFPKTVCGVVFEGAERTTGCQFTFTCDRAMTRWTPSEAAWKRAREVATLALSGSVYRPVGHATHYHTDWVVPYWQSSLDKVARVGTHLFFRWSGWWGTPPAFSRQVTVGEPAIAALAAISPAHAMGAALAQGDAAVLAAVPFTGALPVALASDPDKFVVALDGKAPPEGYRAMALAACGDRPRCLLMGWTDRAMLPTTADLSSAQWDAMAFSYLRDRTAGFERALWNCTATPRPVRTECMRRTQTRVQPPTVLVPPMPAASAAAEPLAGIRRRAEPAVPAPASSPTSPAKGAPAS
jgi:spore germination cell wall hydrolase CwlJ-like protein